MSRSTLLAAVAAVALISVFAGSRLDAQQAAAQTTPAADPQAPRGRLTITTATTDEALVIRDVAIRSIGGRAFLVGAPAERQLTATTPLVWIPVDTVVQMSEVGTTP
jgi:hypothetical protein